MYSILFIPLIISWVIGWRFKNRISYFSSIPLSSGLSGCAIAEKMLRENFIYDVKVVAGNGLLTDHFDPSLKTVSLSSDVYYGTSIASAAIAAHECGHALQQAQAYSFLSLRTGLVPAMNIANTWAPWLIIGGVFALTVFPFLLLAGIALLAITVVFSLITLPIEFDASRRALVWLDNQPGVISGDQHLKATEALRWAAMTYVAAALASLGTLLYYLSFLNKRH